MLRKWLLRLYPRVWRIRYEDEFTALLEQCPLSLFDILDIVVGALDARLHPQASPAQDLLKGRSLPMRSPFRRMAITVFCAYIVFFVAGVAFENMTNDDYFTTTMQIHPEMNVAFDLIVAGFLLALLAIAVGGLPIAWAVLRRALAVSHKDLWLFAVPFLCLMLLVGIGAAWLAIQNGNLQLSFFATEAIYFAYLGLLFLSAIASTAAVSWAVIRSEINARLFRFARIPALLATLGMALTLGAAIVWGLRLSKDTPWIFSGQQLLGGDGRVFAFTTASEWLGIVVVMGIATLIAAIALLRTIAGRSVSQPVASNS